mgnify:FL=1
MDTNYTGKIMTESGRILWAKAREWGWLQTLTMPSLNLAIPRPGMAIRSEGVIDVFGESPPPDCPEFEVITVVYFEGREKMPWTQ